MICDVRLASDRLGRTEHPVALAPGGDDGYTVDDPSRPAIPANLNAHLLEHIAGRMEHIEPLRGSDGRAMLMTDRMRLLAGTDIERRLVGSLGPDGLDALDHHTDRTQLPTTASNGQQVCNARQRDRDRVQIHPNDVTRYTIEDIRSRHSITLAGCDVAADGVEQEGAGTAGRVEYSHLEWLVDYLLNHSLRQPVGGVVLTEALAGSSADH